MPTLSIQVAGGNDDGHFVFGGCYRTNTTVLIGGSNQYRATFRFRSVGLQRQNRILQARLYFQAANTHEYNLQGIKLGLEDTDDANDDLAAVCDAGTRTLTTAYVTWTEIKTVTGNVWYYSPDFGTSVQEVLDRAGWASGNDVAVLLQAGAAAGTPLQVWAYDEGAAHAAYLVIDYVSAIGGAML